jgi:hypothetical protein
MASRNAEEGKDYPKLASFAEAISGVTPGQFRISARSASKSASSSKTSAAGLLDCSSSGTQINLIALLVNQESIKMATKIEQFSYADRVAALTHQYLELGLPQDAALRAAEADL